MIGSFGHWTIETLKFWKHFGVPCSTPVLAQVIHFWVKIRGLVQPKKGLHFLTTLFFMQPSPYIQKVEKMAETTLQLRKIGGKSAQTEAT